MAFRLGSILYRFVVIIHLYHFPRHRSARLPDWAFALLDANLGLSRDNGTSNKPLGSAQDCLGTCTLEDIVGLAQTSPSFRVELLMPSVPFLLPCMGVQ